MEKREVLRERLYDIFKQPSNINSKIYLHGADTYQMIKILYNCGIVPEGIIVSQKKRG